MEFLQSADFWIGLVKIIWINIILSGDNAVVIALAARSLPPEQQKKAILFGSGAAVVLRIVLTVVAAKLLALPYLQIVGGLLLLWIGVQLLGDEEEDEGEGKEYGSMMTAVRTILIAWTERRMSPTTQRGRGPTSGDPALPQAGRSLDAANVSRRRASGATPPSSTTSWSADTLRPSRTAATTAEKGSPSCTILPA